MPANPGSRGKKWPLTRRERREMSQRMLLDSDRPVFMFSLGTIPPTIHRLYHPLPTT